MNDKLAKVRAEIERLKDVDITEFPNINWVKGRNFALTRLEVFIDSMQEEPDLNWKDMSLQEKKDLVAKLSEDIRKEEPTTSVWHDKSEKPKMNSIIVVNNDQTTLSVEYVGQSLCGVERWAYLDNLLKL